MRRPTVILAGVAALYFLAVVLGAFLLPEPLPTWGLFLVWLVAGALAAFVTTPSRWWVALGFLWLGAAWVEAGQAVWLEVQGSAADVIVGCVASGIGVGTAATVRMLRARRAVTPLRTPAAAAPPRR